MVELPSHGLTNVGVFAAVVCLAGAMTVGCHRNSSQGGGVSDEGIVPTDPQVMTNLIILTDELHRSLNQYRLTGKFDEFVEATHVDVPPPPAGQKYAISKNWKVILVDANAK
jgi:hypothetical protein